LRAARLGWAAAQAGGLGRGLGIVFRFGNLGI
jgi:hypothetical protein